MFKSLRFVVFLNFITYSHSAIFYTNPNKDVSSTRDGSSSFPFETVSDCVKALKNPGDECQIHEGTYREDITVSGLRGTKENPIVIRGVPGERPSFDGTVDITPVDGSWKVDGDIYYGEITQQIWQLFFDDLMMTNARWPDANWSEKTVFDGGNHWERTSMTSIRGKIVDKGTGLQESGKDMTGAMAVLNIGSWNTFVAKVDHHEAGQNYFTYDDTFGKIKFNLRLGRYFIEDKLELLDSPEEWFFDKSTAMLYFIPPKNADISPTTQLRGKVQTYALTITDSQHVVLKDLDFFGTTLQAIPSFDEGTYVDNIKLDSLNFNYPCASKRMLLDNKVTQCTNIDGRKRGGVPRTNSGSFTFLNNVFHGADGVPLSYTAAQSRLENNLFSYNDWTSANSLVGDGGHATIEALSRNDTVIRNTLLYNGEGHGIRPGFQPTVKLNRVIGQCWGLQQNDGSGIHLTTNRQTNSHIDHNWVQDSPKYGVRFDGQPPRVGLHGTISNNVLFRLVAGGVQMKGDHHTALNNLAFDTQNGTPRPANDCSLCVWKYVRANPVEINSNSRVVGKVVDVANGGKVFNLSTGMLVHPVSVRGLAGSDVRDNVIDPNIKTKLHDADNNDFRPLTSDITVGPYPYNPTATTYWIPGRQLSTASSPVPPHQATKVIAAHRDTLMWLNSYECETHDVYMGTKKSAVSRASRKGKTFLGTVTGGNVVYLKKKVEAGRKYYWRVDRMCPGEEFVKGEVWEFETI